MTRVMNSGTAIYVLGVFFGLAVLGYETIGAVGWTDPYLITVLLVYGVPLAFAAVSIWLPTKSVRIVLLSLGVVPLWLLNTFLVFLVLVPYHLLPLLALIVGVAFVAGQRRTGEIVGQTT